MARSRLRCRRNIAAAGKAPDERNQKEHRADIGRHRIARQAEDVRRAEPPMHHRPAGAQRHLPERQRESLGRERPLHEVVIADRGATRSDEDIGAHLARTPHPCGGLGKAVGHDAKVDNLTPLPARERHCGVAVGIDDFAETRRGAGHDQFVAGCEYRYFGAAMHRRQAIHPRIG